MCVHLLEELGAWSSSSLVFALGGAGTLLSVPDLSGYSWSELLSSENAGAIVLKIFCSLWRYVLYIRLHRFVAARFFSFFQLFRCRALAVNGPFLRFEVY